jgi:hypothetical protein
VVVRVSKTLDVRINGVGTVEYIGSPQITKAINGIGTLKERQGGID